MKLLSWEGFVFGAKCSTEANASVQGHIYQLNTCLLCGYITPDCTEHPHTVDLAGTSFLVYFSMWKSVSSAQKLSGYTNHINYQAKTKDKGNKIANDKRPRYFSSKALFPINMAELRMSMKVCHLAKTVPSEDISWFYFFPWVPTGSQSGKANHTWYFLFHNIFMQIKTNQQKQLWRENCSNKKSNMFVTC